MQTMLFYFIQPKEIVDHNFVVGDTVLYKNDKSSQYCPCIIISIFDKDHEQNHRIQIKLHKTDEILYCSLQNLYPVFLIH